jgi:hypothetical protein
MRLQISKLTLKSSLLILVLILIQDYSNAQETKGNSDFPKNSILITPLMGLIEDTKSSIYYKRFLLNNSSKYFNLRLGTELLSNVNHTFPSGLEEKMTSSNWKIGFEYGIKFDKSILYFGTDLSNTRYKMNGAIMYPNQNALFHSNNINIEESFSRRDESRLNIFSFIGFLGIKFQITNQINIGIESGIGYGWYNSELIYSDTILPGREQNYKGNLSQITPNRFVFLEFQL